ncbi:MAG: hypothetical protein M1830_004093 [Pleopsidium flavum]|nr:MAG: hypothetical protein M1830_004093 [Pleopsidium flavum]
MDLKEDEVAAFKLLVQWMFTNTVDKPKPTLHESASERRGELCKTDLESTRASIGRVDTTVDGNVGLEKTTTTAGGTDEVKTAYLGILPYAKLYVLADKLGMNLLKNHTIDVLRDGTVQYFPPGIIIWIYQNTAPSSPLRDHAASSASSALLLKPVTRDYYHDTLEVCHDFAFDLVEARSYEAEAVIFAKEPFYDISSRLHEDEEGEACDPGNSTSPSKPVCPSILTDMWSPVVKQVTIKDHQMSTILTELSECCPKSWHKTMNNINNTLQKNWSPSQVRYIALRKLAAIIDRNLPRLEPPS